MSIISRLRRSRHQDKEQHSSKSTDPSKKESSKPKPAPYHHVPVHAASDAIASSPSGSRKADHARVREANRERRAMHSHEYHAGLTGMPRVESSLSTGTYTGSVTSTSAGSSAQSVSHKGKEVDRSPYHTPNLSTSSSKGTESKSKSKSKSRSKRDSLDLTNKSIRLVREPEPPSIPRPHTAVGHPHHLHPSARSPSEVSVDRIALAQVAQLASTPISQRRRSRDQRNMPTVPLTPTQTQTPTKTTPKPPIVDNRISISPTPGASPTYTRSHSRNHSGGYSSFMERHSRQGSVSSLPTLTPTSTKHHSSGPVTPQRSSQQYSSSGRRSSSGHHSLDAAHANYLDFDFQFDKGSIRSSLVDTDNRKEQRRASRTRYQEKEIIDPSVGLLDFGPLKRVGRDAAPSPLTPEHVVNRFPEPASPPTPSRRSSSWKKAGAKLLRKNTKR